MTLQAIGQALPAAMAVALSPFPVIGVVLILSGRDGRRNGPLFAAGWLVGLTVVAALVALVFGDADDPHSTTSTVADWSRVLVGAALILLGVRKWWHRPRRGAVAATPRWMESLDAASPGRALLLGLVLSGANPKNFVLTASATTSMIEAGAHGSELLAGVIVFVLVGSFTVVGAVLLHLFGGQRGVSVLESVREFMVANSTVIMVVVMLIIGANVLGAGLTGLGR